MPIQVQSPNVYPVELPGVLDPDQPDFTQQTRDIARAEWLTTWKNRMLHYMGFRTGLVDLLFEAVEHWSYVDGDLPPEEFTQKIQGQLPAVRLHLQSLLSELVGVDWERLPSAERNNALASGVRLLQNLRRVLDLYLDRIPYADRWGSEVKLGLYPLRVLEMPHTKKRSTGSGSPKLFG